MKLLFYNTAVIFILITVLTLLNLPKIAHAQKINDVLSNPIFNVEQRKELEELIKKYIQKNPEIIIDSVQKLREKQRIGSKETSLKNLTRYKDLIINDPTSPTAGNQQGDVTVVEFFDYGCGYCKRMFSSLKKLINDDKNVRIVFKELPILSPQSELAARAALATWLQNKAKYMEIHEEFMELKGGFSKARIFNIMKNKGLDLIQLENDMGSNKINETIESNQKLAQHLNITGTPGFIIGDNIIPGAIKLESLKEIIKTVRKVRQRTE